MKIFLFGWMVFQVPSTIATGQNGHSNVVQNASTSAIATGQNDPRVTPLEIFPNATVIQNVTTPAIGSFATPLKIVSYAVRDTSVSNNVSRMVVRDGTPETIYDPNNSNMELVAPIAIVPNIRTDVEILTALSKLQFEQGTADEASLKARFVSYDSSYDKILQEGIRNSLFFKKESSLTRFDYHPFFFCRVTLDNRKYINAAHIRLTRSNHVLRFIATPAPIIIPEYPRVSTISEFFDMIYSAPSAPQLEKDSSVYSKDGAFKTEDGKLNEAVLIVSVVGDELLPNDRWWPEDTQTKEYKGTSSNYSCQSLSKDVKDGLIYQTLEIQRNLNEPKKSFEHVHMSTWVDHKAPDKSKESSFTGLISKITNFRGTVIVHCRAGIGRTGVVIIVASFIHEFQMLAKSEFGFLNVSEPEQWTVSNREKILHVMSHIQVLTSPFEKIEFESQIGSNFNIQPFDSFGNCSEYYLKSIVSEKVQEMVVSMRKQRSYMIQTPDQFYFTIEYLVKIFSKQ